MIIKTFQQINFPIVSHASKSSARERDEEEKQVLLTIIADKYGILFQLRHPLHIHELVSGDDRLRPVHLLQLVRVKPAGRAVQVDHVQLQGSAVVAPADVDAHDGILQIGGDDHFENTGRVGNVAIEMLENEEAVVTLEQKQTLFVLSRE